MKHRIARFGEFELDHTAHELRQGGRVVELPASAFDCLAFLVTNRDRPVSRDEIILAVWARPDVSETLLGQTIVRLRKALGDSGGDQRSIRTISRKGYRWVAPTLIVEDEDPVSTGGDMHPAQPESGHPPGVDAALRNRWSSWARVAGICLAAATGAAIAVVGVFFTFRSDQQHAPRTVQAADPALVLPSTTDAPDTWDWLRLGVMDLVANRLRQAGQPTIPSESVVGMLQRLGNTEASDASWLRDARLDATSRLRVQPSVQLAHGEWSVHLAVLDEGTPLDVDARSSDVLIAASQATDLLLVRLGRSPPASRAEDRPKELAEIVQRAKAATLAGRLEVARSIIADAPQELASAPELAWSSALIEAYAGEYDRARERLIGALPGVSAEEHPIVRARMLTLLGAMYMRRAESKAAETAYAQAIGLAEAGKDTSVLAHAYSGRAVVEATNHRYEDALADFGLARALSERSGNVLGVAQTDMNLGSIMDVRGQPAVAARMLEDAARRLQALSSQEEWAVAMQGVASARLRLLDFAGALETADAFSPPRADIADRRLKWMLSLTRARVLAANHRVPEARAEAQAVWNAASAPADALFRCNAAEALARLANIEGDGKEASRLAADALTPELERADVLLFAHAWQLRLAGLRRAGAIEEAHTGTDAYLAWLRESSIGAAEALAAFARAEQANAERRVADARADYARAFEAAERGGVPEDTVAIGTAYARLLLDDGEVANAASVGGRLAPWSDRDPRIADLRVRLKAATQGSPPPR